MGKCESCVWYVYDEEYDDYLCDMDLDEDELARFWPPTRGIAPTGGPATSISPHGNNNVWERLRRSHIFSFGDS